MGKGVVPVSPTATRPRQWRTRLMYASDAPVHGRCVGAVALPTTHSTTRVTEPYDGGSICWSGLESEAGFRRLSVSIPVSSGKRRRCFDGGDSSSRPRRVRSARGRGHGAFSTFGVVPDLAENLSHKSLMEVGKTGYRPPPVRADYDRAAVSWRGGLAPSAVQIRHRGPNIYSLRAGRPVTRWRTTLCLSPHRFVSRI